MSTEKYLYIASYLIPEFDKIVRGSPHPFGSYWFEDYMVIPDRWCCSKTYALVEIREIKENKDDG